jgi:hypothetical protein
MMLADNIYVLQWKTKYKINFVNWKHLSSKRNINQNEILIVVVSDLKFSFISLKELDKKLINITA